MDADKNQSLNGADAQPGGTNPVMQIASDTVPSVPDSRSATRALVGHALLLSRELGASALLLPADAVDTDAALRTRIEAAAVRTILIARSGAPAQPADSGSPSLQRIAIPNVYMNRGGQVKVALLVSLAQGLLQRSDRVLCLSGLDGSGILDACLILNLETEPELFSAADTVLLSGGVSAAVFERTLLIATQLAAEGREGRSIGALFVIGDSQNVMSQSRQLVLNPFQGYPENERNILDPNLQETIKEFSAIDGAFVLRGDGVVLAAGRQLIPSAAGSQLLNGLGTRHAAACAMTATSSSVAIVVSQSTGTISVYKAGAMVTDIQRATNSVRPAA